MYRALQGRAWGPRAVQHFAESLNGSNSVVSAPGATKPTLAFVLPSLGRSDRLPDPGRQEIRQIGNRIEDDVGHLGQRFARAGA